MTIVELLDDLEARNRKAVAEGRPFEDLFSTYQNEMVRQSIAYTENRAERTYIYSDLEMGAFQAVTLFRINGKYYTDNEWIREIREGRESTSLSKGEMTDMKDTILCYAVAVRELCRDYGKPIPTVIKLVYDAKSRRVEAKYGYERLKPLSDWDSGIRCRAWFEEIRANNL